MNILSRDVLFDTTNVATMVKGAFDNADQALTIESAVRELSAAEGTETPTEMGAEVSNTTATPAVGVEKRRQEDSYDCHQVVRLYHVIGNWV
ncbi:hypothetical protein PHMEG_00029869 [Phytophthora megakarya]|uniref:Uncharacterized protein n=1 Tax=Phytophthora megakarya TaxID=4795 RepID=A0A225V176_9STRA|nr:hypothetical protein PHMEG_00029869 [Phytophthora megakarya]